MKSITLLGILVLFLGQSFAQKVKAPEISEQELRIVLREYEYFFVSTVSTSIDAIRSKSVDSVTNKALLRFEMHVIPACQVLLEQADPLKAMLDTWILAERMVLHFKADSEVEAFQDHRQDLLIMAEKILKRIKTVVKLVAPEDCYEGVCRSVQSYAESNPISGEYSTLVFHSPDKESPKSSPLDLLLSVPLALNPKGGVDQKLDEGVLAIKDFTIVADRFTSNVRQLPESVRWQMMLLLYDLKDDHVVSDLQIKLAEISDSHSRLVASIDSFPQKAAKVTDYFTKRMILLVLIFFVMMTAYSLIAGKFRK